MVAGRLVVVHDVIFVDGPRAYAPKGNPLVVQARPDLPRLCSAAAWAEVASILGPSAVILRGEVCGIGGVVPAEFGAQTDSRSGETVLQSAISSRSHLTELTTLRREHPPRSPQQASHPAGIRSVTARSR